MLRSDKKTGVPMKIASDALLILLFFIMLEFSARFYHFIKYKDPTVFLYGRKYFAMLSEKMHSGFFAKAEKPLAGDPAMVDKIFETRKDRNVPITTQEPGNMIMQGIPAYANKYGFRNKDIDIDKAPGTVRIMMLGDSFVMSTGLDDKSTWEYVLNESLNGSSGRYEIVNAGGGGTTIDQQLINLIDKIVKFHPDYVILFSSHKNSMILDYKAEYSLSWKVSTFFYNISQFYAMIRERNALRTFRDNNYYVYDYRVKITKQEIDKLMDLYRKRLAQFYTVCKENDIGLIIGLRPEFIPSGLKELQHPMDKDRMALLGGKLEKQGYLTYYEFEYYTQGLFNMAMEDCAEKNGLLTFDGTRVFPQDKYPYFIDQMHLNREGASIFAGAMTSFIIENDLARSRKIRNDAL